MRCNFLGFGGNFANVGAILCISRVSLCSSGVTLQMSGAILCTVRGYNFVQYGVTLCRLRAGLNSVLSAHLICILGSDLVYDHNACVISLVCIITNSMILHILHISSDVVN